MRKFRSVNPQDSSLKEVHKLLLSGVSPRPIALVSTISEEGKDNLAPFSYFNAFGANPPYVAFSPAYSGKDGSAKDTLLNLQKTPECVIHAVPFDLVEQVSLASTAFPRGISEFVKAGFETLDSDIVKPKRVKLSPFHMECQVEQIIPLGNTNGSGNLVLCRVVRFHISESVLEEGTMNPDALDLVGRNGLNFYTRASGSALFKLDKPHGKGIGIDQLPESIRNSKILSGNDLGKLGSLSSLPSKENINKYLKRLSQDRREAEYIALYKVYLNDPSAPKQKVELAAKMALSEGDTDFAIHVLLQLPEE